MDSSVLKDTYPLVFWAILLHPTATVRMLILWDKWCSPLASHKKIRMPRTTVRRGKWAVAKAVGKQVASEFQWKGAERPPLKIVRGGVPRCLSQLSV